MTLNFVEELVLDWFNLCKNPWKEGGISISDYPTPKPEGKKGGGHGGDIDILSIGKEAIWIAEVETFNGTMKAEKKAEILLRKFREKNNFIKQNFNYLLTEKKEIRLVYVTESKNYKLYKILSSNTNIHINQIYLSEIIGDLIKKFNNFKSDSPSPILTPSGRTLFSLLKKSNLEIKFKD